MARLTVGILAGEASGDNLGAGLMRSLRARHPDIGFQGIGGDAMQAQGLESLVPMDRLAVNGFRDPIVRLPELFGILRDLLRHFERHRPDVFVGVDFNVFNLLLERLLRRRGIATVHYVSPSVYAWRRGRVKRIARSADALLALYPFEAALYEGTPVDVHYVGHPMADAIAPDAGGPAARAAAREALGFDADARVIALLPGSRRSEVQHMLPGFLDAAALLAARWHGQVRFVIPCPRETIFALVSEAVAARPDLDVVVTADDARQALTAADAGIVKSGTSTLEAMLLRRPMVVSYRLGPLAYRLARAMVRTEFVALPNILAGRRLVPELLQDEATPEALAENLAAELYKAGHEPEYLAPFAELHDRLRQNADARAAEAVATVLARTAALRDTGDGN